MQINVVDMELLKDIQKLQLHSINCAKGKSNRLLCVSEVNLCRLFLFITLESTYKNR